MELNALTRWESIGKDLYARGKLGSEIERIKQFSKMLSAARKRKRRSVSTSVERPPTEQTGLGGIAESKEEEEGDVDVEGDDSLTDVSPLPLLDAIEAAEALAVKAQEAQEERMQDELEQKELDTIPPTHRRVTPASKHSTRGF